MNSHARSMPNPAMTANTFEVRLLPMMVSLLVDR